MALTKQGILRKKLRATFSGRGNAKIMPPRYVRMFGARAVGRWQFRLGETVNRTIKTLDEHRDELAHGHAIPTQRMTGVHAGISAVPIGIGLGLAFNPIGFSLLAPTGAAVVSAITKSSHDHGMYAGPMVGAALMSLGFHHVLKHKFRIFPTPYTSFKRLVRILKDRKLFVKPKGKELTSPQVSHNQKVIEELRTTLQLIQSENHRMLR